MKARFYYEIYCLKDGVDERLIQANACTLIGEGLTVEPENYVQCYAGIEDYDPHDEPFNDEDVLDDIFNRFSCPDTIPDDFGEVGIAQGDIIRLFPLFSSSVDARAYYVDISVWPQLSDEKMRKLPAPEPEQVHTTMNRVASILEHIVTEQLEAHKARAARALADDLGAASRETR